MNKIVIMFVLAGVIILTVTLSFKNFSDHNAELEANSTTGNNVASTGEVAIGGDFILTNHLNEQVDSQTFRDKYMLVYFGFTNCAHICPTDMAFISQALSQLSKEHLEQVQPIFITIDPERDNPEQITNFLANFHNKFIGFTGTKEEVQSVKDKYRIYAKKAVDEDLAGYQMDHSTYIYLMDGDGKYNTHFSDEQFSSQTMAEKISNIINASNS